MSDDYTLAEHMHRFGAWAASRAASVSGCRFTVQEGRGFIERAGLQRLVLAPDALPEPGAFDDEHRRWRREIVGADVRSGLVVTHGVAAKLINVYLKAAVLPASTGIEAQVAALHPPIDALLLQSLAQANFGGKVALWRQVAKTRWSKMDSDQYEAVIAGIRRALPAGAPLWKTEEHWRGYQ